MNPLMFFLFICTVIVVSYILGNRIGYLQGKAEVSHVPRGEPPEINVDEQLGTELQQIIDYVESGKV